MLPYASPLSSPLETNGFIPTAAMKAYCKEQRIPEPFKVEPAVLDVGKFVAKTMSASKSLPTSCGFNFTSGSVLLLTPKTDFNHLSNSVNGGLKSVWFVGYLAPPPPPQVYHGRNMFALGVIEAGVCIPCSVTNLPAPLAAFMENPYHALGTSLVPSISADATPSTSTSGGGCIVAVSAVKTAVPLSTDSTDSIPSSPSSETIPTDGKTVIGGMNDKHDSKQGKIVLSVTSTNVRPVADAVTDDSSLKERVIHKFNPSAIVLPMSTVVFGAPGCGKTSFIFNLLSSFPNRFKHAFAWSTNPVTCELLSHIMPRERIFSTFDEKVLDEKVKYVRMCRDVANDENYCSYKDYNSVFIFDGILSDPFAKNSKKLHLLLSSAHHDGISIISSAYYANDIPKGLRSCFRYVALTYSGAESVQPKHGCHQFFESAFKERTDFLFAFDHACTSKGECMISVKPWFNNSSGGVFSWKYQKIGELAEFKVLSDVGLRILECDRSIKSESSVNCDPSIPGSSNPPPSSGQQGVRVFGSHSDASNLKHSAPSTATADSKDDGDILESLKKYKTIVSLLSTSMVLLGCNFQQRDGEINIGDAVCDEVSRAMKMLVSDPDHFDVHAFAKKVASLNKVLMALILQDPSHLSIPKM